MVSAAAACSMRLASESGEVQVIFNPKDTNTFASASLDRSVKVRVLILAHAFGRPCAVEGWLHRRCEHCQRWHWPPFMLVARWTFQAAYLGCQKPLACVLSAATMKGCMSMLWYRAAANGRHHGVQVWSIGQPTPNFTLEGHEKGVNTVDYFTGGKAANTVLSASWAWPTFWLQ